MSRIAVRLENDPQLSPADSLDWPAWPKAGATRWSGFPRVPAAIP